jgi:hypothetical protein
MGNFSAAKAAEDKRPRRVIEVPASIWADDWKGERPYVVGLRRLSARDLDTALAESAKEAVEALGDGDEGARQKRYHENLITWIVALGTCSAADASQPLIECAEAELRRALRPEGVRRLYDELEAHYASDSPIVQPATDEDVANLPRALLALPKLPPAKQLRVRKFLRYCLDALTSDDD